MRIGRRAAMGVGIAGGAAAALGLPRPAQAATAAAAAGANGFYRFKVGDITVTQVHDGYAERPLEAGWVRNAELAEVQAALEAAFQPTATVTIPFTTTVVETGGRLVLIDAGTGGFGPTTGLWMDGFRAAGYAPEQVDLVVFSHFHGDHIQGFRNKDGAAVFPNAAVMVPEAEWAFWMDDARMSAAPEAMQGAFQGVRRVFGPIQDKVERFTGERELAPGLTALPAQGHTPGHTVFLVTSGEGRHLVWSDTTNKPELFVRNPTWQVQFDMDGEAAMATRLRLLDMAAAERMTVGGYHFPFPAVGHIGRDGSGYAYVPTFWRAV